MQDSFNQSDANQAVRSGSCGAAQGWSLTATTFRHLGILKERSAHTSQVATIDTLLRYIFDTKRDILHKSNGCRIQNRG